MTGLIEVGEFAGAFCSVAMAMILAISVGADAGPRMRRSRVARAVAQPRR